jgi:hypothetical protein
MLDPVSAPDGCTYERAALLEWLRVSGDVSPMTGQPLSAGALVPHYALRQAILADLPRLQG